MTGAAPNSCHTITIFMLVVQEKQAAY